MGYKINTKIRNLFYGTGEMAQALTALKASRPGFSFQHPHGSHTAVTPVPEDLGLPGLCRHLNMRGEYEFMKVFIHIKNSFKTYKLFYKPITDLLRKKSHL